MSMKTHSQLFLKTSKFALSNNVSLCMLIWAFSLNCSNWGLWWPLHIRAFLRHSKLSSSAPVPGIQLSIHVRFFFTSCSYPSCVMACFPILLTPTVPFNPSGPSLSTWLGVWSRVAPKNSKLRYACMEGGVAVWWPVSFLRLFLPLTTHLPSPFTFPSTWRCRRYRFQKIAYE